MKKNLIVFGTRPEAIKMIPLLNKFKEFPELFETKVCVTAQHREMLDQVLDFFDVTPDYDLNIMKPGQDLYSLTSDIISQMKDVLQDFSPDYVYVHGDTTTTMATAIAAFYSHAKVCHVEAGLRTFDKKSPFPEEMNRQVAGRIADYHFAPTSQSKMNLLKENISENTILVTGNTVIDALMDSSSRVENYYNKEIESIKNKVDLNKKIILVTGHRRENHGQGFINICLALKELAHLNPEIQILYPVHLNPNVKNVVYELLADIKNIILIEPLSYPSFVWIMKKSYIVLTDSGGIQEEAPSLGKPVLVMRDTTERPESVEAGTVILVGSNKDKIVSETMNLLNDKDFYKKTSEIHNPYGDGMASERIVNFIAQL
ncbi:non-hydrolyzing UDP-N-acetylglucosamine 2-epimerase [Epilithonimonas sp.]|uniref:non-hydrolyzing UDP-N-acetylglucosamine 2-epimerase n=1 Tax=Epilithonimonas sp. TaxID=2894511 RepID=UPI0028981EE4|nr:UDP-N-acetylglucosamine 2-epimerase (non-hydrolyzing) [Epilithonimonas sp.]